MSTYDYDELVARIRGMTQRDRARVAELGGVPWSTVHKVALGFVTNPRYSTVKGMMDGLALYDGERQPTNKKRSSVRTQ